MRMALLLLCMLGTLIFGAAFVLSFTNPVTIERAARELMRIELERQVGQKIDSLSNTRIAKLAEGALLKLNSEIKTVQRNLRDEVPQKVANIIANMLNADCECRKRLVANAIAAEELHFGALKKMRAKLDGLIESTYAKVSAGILRELRIFSAINATAFLFLGLLTLRRQQHCRQLMLPAIVVLGAVGISISCYLFNQDWLHTLVFSDYLGYGYAAYLLIVALLLADIAFNRARVTGAIIRSVFDTAPTPC
jgi:hypothetical protein